MKSYDMRKYNPRCCYCGKFAGYNADSFTPFGCADPSDPEPYDPEYICAKCEKIDYEKWLEDFGKGRTYGNWCKSRSETSAAEKMNLMWVHEPSYVDPRNGRHYFNEWVPKDKIPKLISYLGYHQELRMVKSLKEK